jgi:hypothetical protein
MPLASRIVLFGFDGLRPDRVTPETMPHLTRFMAEGTRFAKARSVFPSETRVAIPSLATGCRPGTHGLVANSLYDAAAAPDRVLNTKHAADIDALIAAHGQLLAVPSLGARLAAAGHALDVVWTGTLGAARAFFPEAAALDGFRWHPEEAVGPGRGLEARFGVAPPAATPNTARVRHAARLFVEHVLGQRRATVAAFWSSEPDVTYHYCGVGSAEAEAAMRAVDAAFGEVLRWRDAQPDRDGIVVIALSDHGHVTGEAELDLQAALRAGGFAAARDFGDGAEIALGGGGAPGLWLRDPGDAARLAAWLNAQPWSGLVLAREAGIAGTIPLATLGARHARSPDLAVTFAGSSDADTCGVPGRGLIDAGDVPVGGGMHGGLHERELATVLAMAGGPLLRGAVMQGAADLTDVAPSVLALLGLARDGMDGRALVQAWGDAADAAPEHDVLRPLEHRPGLRLVRLGATQRPDAMIAS